MVAIGEILVAPQIAAIGVLLAGVLCLTAFRKEEKNLIAKDPPEVVK